MTTKYLFNRSYSGQHARSRLTALARRYARLIPARILTGLQAGLLVLIAWIFITLYLIATN